jgi:hypothetical protein
MVIMVRIWSTNDDPPPSNDDDEEVGGESAGDRDEFCPFATTTANGATVVLE